MAGGVHGGGACVARGHAWQGACMAVGHAWWGVCVAEGACMAEGVCVAGGMHGGGCVWQGGVCGRGGHAWQGGVCVAGGMHGGGCVWQGGVCVAGGMHGRGDMCGTNTPPARYYEIWSMSGRYASYWNAYLFYIVSFVSFSHRCIVYTTSKTVKHAKCKSSINNLNILYFCVVYYTCHTTRVLIIQ